MKQFLKYVLATIVGFSIVCFFMFFLLFAVIGVIASVDSKETSLTDNSVYQLNLNGRLQEQYEENPFEMLIKQETGRDASIGLDDIISNIKKAKDNPKIIGIRLNCGALSGGYSSMKEIRDALIDFKSSGKFLVSYADAYTQKTYYVASVCDKVLLNPIGVLSFSGLAANVTFYKNMLDKLGVEMQVVRVGQFKSAVEPMINTKMSDSNRKQTEVFLFSMWKSILEEVSASRNIPVDDLNAYSDENFQFAEAKKALDFGLVDSLVYESEMANIMNALTDSGVEVKYIKHTSMSNLPVKKKYKKNKVALIYAVGGIDVSSEGIQSEKLVKTIQKVAKDDAVKAVVLRVNSPGGSAYGSEQIWEALKNLKEKKPLIVSMGDYAASGGYYIACLGDKILAQPTTLTGSIGVFGQIPNASKLLEKIGLNFDVVKTNKFSEGISFHRPFSVEEKALLQTQVNQTYALFLKRCADGRAMTVEQIEKIAEGRVWSGENALEIGLVDQLGGLEDALALAANTVELENYGVVVYPEKRDFFNRFLRGMDEEVRSVVLKSYSKEVYSLLKQMEVLELEGALALMPYDMEVN